MKPLRALLIDDNDKARIALKDDLKAFPEVLIAGEASSATQALLEIQKIQPDILFLDIQLGDGSGFDVLEKAKAFWKGQVIFTTAYNEYALKAFKYAALDYLLKPVDPEELAQALSKIPVSTGQAELQWQLLMEQLQPKATLDRIAINSHDKIVLVEINDIVQLESQSNYTLFHLHPHKQLLSTKTLKEYEEILPPQHFIRVHHSHLIHLNFVKEFHKLDSVVIMKDGSQVPVSVRKKDILMKALGL